jgi:hypothetical protein
VPREWFGMAKRAAEPFLWREPAFLTAPAQRDYAAFLSSHRGSWLRRFRLPPWTGPGGDRTINRASAVAAAVARRVGPPVRRLPGLGRIGARLSSMHPRLLNLRRYWFPWAVARAEERYRSTTP